VRSLLRSALSVGRCSQVRNAKGRELLDSIGEGLQRAPPMATGDRRPLVLQTAIADDTAKLGQAPDPMPRWLGNILAWVLEKVRIHSAQRMHCARTACVVRSLRGRLRQHIVLFGSSIRDAVSLLRIHNGLMHSGS
jgi:hypothetical protein